jgi:GrpB-like predicted nucleotidyltransferase (UPF0157 family)
MSYLFKERLEKFKQYDLGLERDNVVRLIPHNERWKRVFSDEAYLILHSLNIDSLKLYHCGSTAIPNIMAKPIIDIVGSISSLTGLDEVKSKLEEIGYEYKGEYGIKGRRYSVLYSPDKKIGYCHLHIFKEGSTELHDHLSFRDYLRIDSKAATKYEECKTSLDIPRDQYSKQKGSTIKELMSSSKPYYFPRKKVKVLAILGAAEGGKNTLDYIESLFANNDLEVIDLNTMEVESYKYKAPDEQDDFISIIEKFIDADRVVFATPVYWYAMSGIMKDFIDRFSDLLGGNHKELGEKLYGKKIDLLSTGSDLEIPNGFSVPFNLTAVYFGMDFMSVYYKSVR